MSANQRQGQVPHTGKGVAAVTQRGSKTLGVYLLTGPDDKQAERLEEMQLATFGLHVKGICGDHYDKVSAAVCKVHKGIALNQADQAAVQQLVTTLNGLVTTTAPKAGATPRIAQAAAKLQRHEAGQNRPRLAAAQKQLEQNEASLKRNQR